MSDILARIIRHRPDVVVLTEFRNDRAGESLRAGLADMGLWYQHSVSASEKANGVLIASREFVDVAQLLTAELEKPHMLLDAQVAGVDARLAEGAEIGGNLGGGRGFDIGMTMPELDLADPPETKR